MSPNTEGHQTKLPFVMLHMDGGKSICIYGLYIYIFGRIHHSTPSLKPFTIHEGSDVNNSVLREKKDKHKKRTFEKYEN